MTLLSTLRAAHYLARDILPALRRLVTPPDDDDRDVYAEHLAQLHAEMAGKQAGRDFADALAEREAAEGVSEPIDWTSIRDIPQPEPRVVAVPIRDYQAEAAERMCDEGGKPCGKCCWPGSEQPLLDAGTCLGVGLREFSNGERVSSEPPLDDEELAAVRKLLARDRLKQQVAEGQEAAKEARCESVWAGPVTGWECPCTRSAGHSGRHGNAVMFWFDHHADASPSPADVHKQALTQAMNEDRTNHEGNPL